MPGQKQAHEHLLDFDMMGVDLSVGYAFNSTIELELRVPYRWAFIEARFLDDMGNELTDFKSIHHRTETVAGLGDLGLELRYRTLGMGPQTPWRLDVLVGLTFPTGGIEPDPFQLGRDKKEHQHLFFGTGTVNPILGLEVERRFRQFSLVALTRWEGALYSNSENYKGPQTLTVALDALSALGAERWRFKVGTEFMKQWPAQWANQLAQNSGRTEIGPVVGVMWQPIDKLSILLNIRRPFILVARGTRLAVPLFILFGVSFSFDT